MLFTCPFFNQHNFQRLVKARHTNEIRALQRDYLAWEAGEGSLRRYCRIYVMRRPGDPPDRAKLGGGAYVAPYQGTSILKNITKQLRGAHAKPNATRRFEPPHIITGQDPHKWEDTAEATPAAAFEYWSFLKRFAYNYLHTIGLTDMGFKTPPPAVYKDPGIVRDHRGKLVRVTYKLDESGLPVAPDNEEEEVITLRESEQEDSDHEPGEIVETTDPSKEAGEITEDLSQAAGYTPSGYTAAVTRGLRGRGGGPVIRPPPHQRSKSPRGGLVGLGRYRPMLRQVPACTGTATTSAQMAATTQSPMDTDTHTVSSSKPPSGPQ